jgi:hypothetical protein
VRHCLLRLLIGKEVSEAFSAKAAASSGTLLGVVSACAGEFSRIGFEEFLDIGFLVS